jgi:hypothetical protein
MEEAVKKGCCRTLDQVAEATGALLGKACHVVNPSGQCCGPEVKAAVVKALRLAGFSEDSEEVHAVLGEAVDRCRRRFGLNPMAHGEKCCQLN